MPDQSTTLLSCDTWLTWLTATQVTELRRRLPDLPAADIHPHLPIRCGSYLSDIERAFRARHEFDAVARIRRTAIAILDEGRCPACDSYQQAPEEEVPA